MNKNKYRSKKIKIKNIINKTKNKKKNMEKTRKRILKKYS